LENDNRQTQTLISNREVSFEEGIKAVLDKLRAANKVLMLVSPDCTLEQMWAVKSIATLFGATLSGYSAAYIKDGDGDDYLICDDKAANRKGLELLQIDTDRATFESDLNETDLFINFDNDLFFTQCNDALKPLAIAICRHQLPVFSTAAIVLPAASYTEYGGSVINENGVLQRFSKAVSKNFRGHDILEITRLLGGAVIDAEQAWLEFRESIPILADVQPEHIPAEGLTLTTSEDDHVGS
jgi:NADH-quinone oxidoreductase subunit G